MKPIKSDRRINRTRRQLREALMSLLLEKGYSTVTVEEITNRADLGRTTFYLHYRDKEELLLESIETTAEELRAQVDQLLSTNSSETNYSNAIHFVFQQAAKNASLYRIILSGGAANSVLNRIREIFSEAALEFFQRRLSDPNNLPSAIPLDVVAHAFATSMLGLMTWWLEQGIPYSAEQISSYFRILFFSGALSVLDPLQEK